MGSSKRAMTKAQAFYVIDKLNGDMAQQLRYRRSSSIAVVLVLLCLASLIVQVIYY